MIFRLGRLLTGGARGPGVFFIIPCVDIYEKIDMRTSTYEIPPQEILTKDSVTVFVNAIMYYKVRGDKILQQGKSILKVKDGLCHCNIDALVVSICLLSTLFCFQVLLQVKDATSAVANVDDYSGSAQLLAATTLRNQNL